MSFKSSSIFVYGLLLLAFSISADSTPIPEPAEHCVYSNTADSTATSQTSEIKLKLTIRKDLKPEGRTLRVDFDIEQETVSEEEDEDFDADRENVPRDLDGMNDYVTYTPDEELSPRMGDKLSKQERMGLSFADVFGAGSQPKGNDGKGRRFLSFFDNELKSQAPVKHSTDDGPENKNFRKQFLFDNGFGGDHGGEASRLFAEGNSRGQRTQFLFDDDIGTSTKLNLASSRSGSSTTPQED